MLFHPLFANFMHVLCAAALLILLPAPGNFAPLGNLPALADDDDEGDDDDDDGPRAVGRAPALPDYAPDEILLINPSDAALSKAVELGFNVYSTEVIRSSQLTIARLRLPPGLDAPSALAALRRETPGQTADLNHFYRLQQAADVSDNPYTCASSRCYGQRMINWTRETAACGDGVKIGLIDTGVDLSHPSLSGQSIKTVSFAPPLTRPSSTQHGTAVAALLAGKSGREIQGLVPKARVYAADVFHVSAAGQLTADAVSIARAIGWLKEQGVSVINISLSGFENRILEQAVKDALAAKISVVAAAGNDGPKAPPSYPAAIPGVIAVTAVDGKLRPYRRAAQGSHIAYAAPGVNIWTAQPRGRYGAATGTSYAAPFVTAVLAVTSTEMWSSLPSKDLGATGADPIFGAGLIQPPQRCALETTRIGNGE